MSVKYKLVVKKNLGNDKKDIPEKKYAQIVSGDFVGFDEFVEEVGDSSAVLDRMNVILVRHLQHGRRVTVGELGTFRFTIGSSGVTDEKSFDTNLIREPKVRFFPGKALRTIKSQVSFEKLSEKKDEENGGGDRPEIE